MTNKQIYITGGAAGVILVILVAWIAYYGVKLKGTEEALAAEKASRATFEEESKRLGRELNASQAEVAAKIVKIEILEETIGEVQQRAVSLGKVKAEIEAEKRKRKAEYQDLVASLEREIKNSEIRITELDGMLTVNLMDKVLFDSGSSAIKPAGKRVLDKIATTFLNRYPNREIRVGGHTDNLAFRGSVRNNWNLSTERAISAVIYLQEGANVRPGRLAAVGYAHHRPIDTNETRDGRARNRRIEIVVMPPKKVSTD